MVAAYRKDHDPVNRKLVWCPRNARNAPRNAPRDRLPRIRIPLADDDSDVRLDIQAAVAKVYEAGSYRARIDYNSPCQPPLEEDCQVWANGFRANRMEGI